MRNAQRCVAIVSLAAAAVLFVAGASAHEIPSDVTVRIIVRPTAERLEVLVRVPLEAIQDIEMPTFGPGYLDLARAEQPLRNAALVWLARDIEVYADGRHLGPLELEAVRASIPSDRSFADYATAIAHVRGPPLPDGTQLVWQQALLDVLFEAPPPAAGAKLSIEPRLARLGMRVVTVLELVAADGTLRVLQLDGNPGRVQLDPRWHQSFLRFLRSGFEHILGGIDHLLFLLCLVLPLRRKLGALVSTVTAFTLGHSVTLIAAAEGLAPNALWFPPLIETLIAASILYMAIENVVAPNVRTRFGIALGFGLVHGFGFSFALQNTLQLAGDHVVTALLAFNVGIELGQLLVLLAMLPVLNLAFRYVAAERIGVVVLSVLVGHTAWHWLAERFAALRAFVPPLFGAS